MANSLLDFVMSVVRDPDAAAQYAANPAQAIADANLTDVTHVDVNNLIPVVAEQMSMAVPSTGSVADAMHDGGNVWASGAATAAFDAFDDHLPIQGNDLIADHVPTIVDQPADVASTVIDTGFGQGFDDGFGHPAVPSTVDPSDPSLHLNAPVIDDVAVADALDDSVDGGHHLVDGHHGIGDHLPDPQDPGFDIFT